MASISFTECVELAKKRDIDETPSFAKALQSAKEYPAKNVFDHFVNGKRDFVSPLGDKKIKIEFDENMKPEFYTSYCEINDGTLVFTINAFYICVQKVINGETYCVDNPIADAKEIKYTIGNFALVTEEPIGAYHREAVLLPLKLNVIK